MRCAPSWSWTSDENETSRVISCYSSLMEETNEVDYYAVLPSELWLQIVSLFPLVDLLRLSRVSRQLNYLVYQCTEVDLKFSNTQLPDDKLLDTLRKFDRIRSLKFTTCKANNEMMRYIATSCTGLQELDLGYTLDRSVDRKRWGEHGLANLTNLTSLSSHSDDYVLHVKSYRVYDIYAAILVTTLEKLDLSHSDFLGDYCLSLLRKLPNLTDLNLSFNSSTKWVLPTQYLTNLRKLNLSRPSTLTVNHWKELTNLTALRELHLRFMPVEYKQLESLERLPHLEVVYLGGKVASVKPRRNQKQVADLDYSGLKFKVVIDDSEYTKKVYNPTTRLLKNWREANNANNIPPVLEPLRTDVDSAQEGIARSFSSFNSTIIWSVIVAGLAMLVLWLKNSM